QTFFPAAVPLAVRMPTFNCWLNTSNGSNPMATWPTVWNDVHSVLGPCADGRQTLGWAGSIKVNGLTYHWLGQPGGGNASIWLVTEVTPTRTILIAQAGPMLLNITFLSPVEVCRLWPWGILCRG
ncbi:hypothetical protein DFH08DRAFT_685729, partial [Mycena albidolilacea]